ncbi:AAA family ATPase [Bifidobacterium fermentum]|uniref:AAA family ATPase n=1 Tax=Bifidobacterium fermentum TaxID=3059035 RepID=A0AB39UI11_9BIFI|nr:AAA family ATPase [Bifidobacterium psychraerophilum]
MSNVTHLSSTGFCKRQVTRLEGEKTALLAQTQSESKSAEIINTLLKSLSNSSFKLILEKTPGQGTGNDSIQGPDGKIRTITDLSTGEKNIIAFLYFMENYRLGKMWTSPSL